LNLAVELRPTNGPHCQRETNRVRCERAFAYCIGESQWSQRF
jgi:hypothetical protein